MVTTPNRVQTLSTSLSMLSQTLRTRDRQYLKDTGKCVSPGVADTNFKQIAYNQCNIMIRQNANMALKLAHRGYVMETGRITLADTTDSLLANEEVKKAYLGV